MVIVTLKDGTTYNMDTDDEYSARSIVDYKLRQRLDSRQILSSQLIKGVKCDSNSKYTNSCSMDSKELQCSSGWSYKWN
jgi:hypothetical protein